MITDQECSPKTKASQKQQASSRLWERSWCSDSSGSGLGPNAHDPLLWWIKWAKSHSLGSLAINAKSVCKYTFKCSPDSTMAIYERHAIGARHCNTLALVFSNAIKTMAIQLTNAKCVMQPTAPSTHSSSSICFHLSTPGASYRLPSIDKMPKITRY